MSRTLRSVTALLLAVVATTPALAADWFDEGTWELGDDLRGPYLDEPKDWSGLGDEDDSIGLEVGLRYWYSWGAHRMTVLGGSYTGDDTSHIIEGHLRIDDHSSDVYAKALAGYSAVISSNYATPSVAGSSSQEGLVKYIGADIGYAPLGDGGTMFGGFAGYQYWHDSPDQGGIAFTAGATPDDINYHMVRLGLSGRVDLGEVVDITAEVAAIPYAHVFGIFGAFDGSAAPGNQTSAGSINGWLYGAAGEVMARIRPHENWAIGVGGRAWYLTGNPDVTFTTDSGGGTTWITKATQFSTLRYGLLGEVTYKF